jgi:hypothetical protein
VWAVRTVVAFFAGMVFVGCAHAPPPTPLVADEPPALVAAERKAPKFVTPPLVDAAEAYLAAAGKHAVVGSEHFETIDGRPYVLVIEWHYHPPGFVGAPTGWHKGVTVYELKQGPTALTTP